MLSLSLLPSTILTVPLSLTGFEISDVLSINDKDYSITFGLYFSVEWLEPRLNLSKDLWSEGNRTTEMELVPGTFWKQNLWLILSENFLNYFINWQSFWLHSSNYYFFISKEPQCFCWFKNIKVVSPVKFQTFMLLTFSPH